MKHSPITKATPHPQPRTIGQKQLTIIAALVALVVIAYLPAINGGFIWDDDLYVHN